MNIISNPIKNQAIRFLVIGLGLIIAATVLSHVAMLNDFWKGCLYGIGFFMEMLSIIGFSKNIKVKN